MPSKEKSQVIKRLIHRLIKTFFNSMPNGCSKQAYVQGFDCGNFFQAVNMF